MRNHKSNSSSPEEGKQISLPMAANGGQRNKNCAGLQYVSFHCQEVISILSRSVFPSALKASMPQCLHPSHSRCVLLPFSFLLAIVPFFFALLFFPICLFSSMPLLPTYSNFNANIYLVHILSTCSSSHSSSTCVVRQKLLRKKLPFAPCLLKMWHNDPSLFITGT